MAITRRQFVTRLGALAATMGVSQSQLAKMTEAFAYGNFGGGKWTKPKVIWVHGAECTGCSTSVLGLLEDATETIEATTASGTSLSLLDALAAAVGTDTSTILSTYRTRTTYMNFEDNTTTVDIADVLIDFIDLQYHETVMGMGGDLAAQFLKDQMDNSGATAGGAFVLVVEGAVQPTTENGYWNAAAGTSSIDPDVNLPWCSIGASDDAYSAGNGFDIAFEDAVYDLASSAKCLAVIAIGQCACFGGYPAAVSPVLREGMTGAMGVYEFIHDHKSDTSTAAKVVNVPGCPTNPWWFALTVVAWLVDANAVLGGGSPVIGLLDSSAVPSAAAVDRDRRPLAVYDYAIHGPNCPRWPRAAQYDFATEPGDQGCMRDLGCKGVFTKSMCGVHGWNGQQPKLLSASGWDSANDDHGVADECKTVGNGRVGSFCVTAGSTCKGCTERGYPDSFVPFIALD